MIGARALLSSSGVRWMATLSALLLLAILPAPHRRRRDQQGRTGSADPVDVCPRVADPGQSDADADRAGDACDNCTARANASQIDSDQDGYGNRCDADYDNDGGVGLTDFGLFRAQFGATVGSPGFEAAFDSDGDGAITILDFGVFRQGFGDGAPGPSGLACAGSIPCSAP